ncbi:putative glycosyl transferase [Prochlorococcus marinus subsp. pastoris str. CCMP1986]|uniref:Putative glycosyl transferase n=1 Tax=Prochlorococcus marinus subsp. pastoris (strain CCMP1986 / NIES-2087 / MED4) TaxID=59919 RepID=Q7V0N6_PROMP|nr:glycosyltransferase family 2 protein [Prochlorococcus marinus]CAE19679.1 putative glycosyl transferase [Prochlorococcus marinus subsp. pastoris str. CCMP1986]
MSKNAPLVTIGILCFNAESSILNALSSALNQTYKKKEIIVIDDCSTDNSLKVIKESKYINDIKVFKNKQNKGAAYSRNIITKKSKGSYICYMDDDDFSDKKRIEIQLKGIIDEGFKKSDCVISICNINREYSSGYIKEMKVFGSKALKPNNYEMIDFLLFNEKKAKVDYGFGCPACAMLISKKALEIVKGFDETLKRVEDMDITIRLSREGCNFINSKKTFVNQLSTLGEDKLPINNLKSEIQIIKKNKNYLKNKNIYSYSRLWPYLRFYHFTGNYFFLIFFLIVIFFINPKRTLYHFISSTINRIKHEHKIKNFKKRD